MQIECELDDANLYNKNLEDKIAKQDRLTINFEASLEERQKLQNEIYSLQIECQESRAQKSKLQKELEAALDQVMILEVRVKNQGVLENDI